MKSNEPVLENTLTVQINDYDTYQAVPTKLDQLYSHVSQVPIIRVYASLTLSHKDLDQIDVYNVLVHVHNYYPYLYFDCLETDSKRLSSDTYTRSVASYLENLLTKSFAINKKRKRNNDDYIDEISDNEVPESTGPSKPRKYIALVSICKGTPVYGYHIGHKVVFKVSLLSPVYKTRLTQLILEGLVDILLLNRKIESPKKQPQISIYEAHLPYQLQFLTDFNLFGCGWLHINRHHLYFRTPILSDLHLDVYNDLQLSQLKQFLLPYMTKSNILMHDPDSDFKYNRMGKSLLEIDTTTQAICNRDALQPKQQHEDFSEYREYLEMLSSKKPYKMDENGNRQIYLSSLKHVTNDLRFQCESRGFSMVTDKLSSPVTTSQSQYLGMGSSLWSNQADLDELLLNAIRVNGTNTATLDEFESKVPRPFSTKKVVYNSSPILPIDLKTSFDLIDSEKVELYHDYELRHNADLLNWNGNVETIFNNRESTDSLVLSSQQNETGMKIGGKQNHIIMDVFSDEDAFSLDEYEGDEIHIAPHLNEEKQEPIILEDEDVDDDEDEDEDEDVDDEGSQDVTQLKHFDEQLVFQLTQKRNQKSQNVLQTHTQISSNEKSPNSPTIQVPSSFDKFSFSETPSDQCPSFNRNELGLGKNSYEVLVPQYLGKFNILDTFDNLGILKINYLDPFYEKDIDAPPRPMILANKKMEIAVVNERLIKHLPMSQTILDHLDNTPSKENQQSESFDKFNQWEYSVDPPLKESVNNWLKNKEEKAIHKSIKFRSQIEPGDSQERSYKLSYKSLKVKRKAEGYNFLTNFQLEVHVNTDDELYLPNPSENSISMIFYNFDDSNNMFPDVKFTSGILVLDHIDYNPDLLKSILNFLPDKSPIEIFDDETEMVDRLIKLVSIFDPDIISGYEVNSMSWGFIIERFRKQYGINLLPQLSRSNFKSNGKFGDRWGYTHTSNIKVSGRHTMNIWRILKSDITLTGYSLENVNYHLLHQSLPKYLNYWLTKQLKSGQFLSSLLVFKYYLRRMFLILKMVEVQELITRNVEHARIIGIDFNSVFYRGSQYKVESILARLTKQEALLLNSPSKKDVLDMKPIECVPLILEPDSNFYKSPMVVLDFQSLYPSIMIAYNYCYSTLLGRLNNFQNKKNPIGHLKHLSLPPGLLDMLVKEDGINLSPNGCMFVKSNFRKSVLAKMLEEILDSRIKVKSVMKLFKEDSELTKLYNARQLALKLIANVTYGYTSATFSGRMPNSDISDAIVATGREILSKSIQLIDDGNDGAKVVYGDTDSLFVYFPGKSKDDAFKIGKRIAQAITDHFPDPIKLKFEKVYLPSVLLTKKRYVGFSYEYEDQKVPKFDAKGIETVRRDGIPAQLKILEKMLRILFTTRNLSMVKYYVLKQFYKISINKVSIKDFCFAKEVRFGTYKSEQHLPPGAIVAGKMVDADPRKEPQYKERVPYVVILDVTKPRIKDRCLSPQDFIASFRTSNPYNLDYEYYITRVLIPPLERVLNLIGADVRGWYRELPKFVKNQASATTNVLMLSRFIRTNHCYQCEVELNKTELISRYLCVDCQNDELLLVSNMSMNYKSSQLKVEALEDLCRICVDNNFDTLGYDVTNSGKQKCSNLDCSVFFNKFKAKNESFQVLENNNKVLTDLSW